MKAFFFPDFYQNDIIPNLTDTFPGDNIFTVSSEKTTKMPWSRYNQGCQAACGTVKFHINGASQAPAGADIDDFLLLQLTKAHR